MRKPIAENRQIHIGVIACPKNERNLAFAAKLPELEIFQVNVERLHARDEQAGQAFAIATTQEEKLYEPGLRLEEQIDKDMPLIFSTIRLQAAVM